MTIKEARTAAGWTQARLSEELEIPRRTIEDWERGISNPPKWVETLILREIIRRTQESE